MGIGASKYMCVFFHFGGSGWVGGWNFGFLALGFEGFLDLGFLDFEFLDLGFWIDWFLGCDPREFTKARVRYLTLPYPYPPLRYLYWFTEEPRPDFSMFMFVMCLFV